MSDAGGRFTLPHVPQGAKADLRVHARGFADWPVSYQSDDQPAIAGMTDEYTIRLEPAAVVEGTVTRDGKPAAGAPVCAQGISPTTGWAVARTDEQGRYRLEALGGGAYSIMIDDLPDLVAPAHAPVKTVSGQTLRGIDFQLTPGGLIEGRIIDADTGQPVTGVRAAGYGPTRPRDGGGACFGTDVDQQGRYRLRVAPGRNYIYYQGGAEDYPFAEGANFEIEVAEGQTVQAPDLRLTRAKPLVVLVVGPDGQPVPGALVQTVTEFGFQREADAGGKCEIRGIPPERAAVLLARDPQRTLCGTAVVKPEARGELATVTLAPPASVEVRFVDPRGKPLAGARVSAWLRLPEGAAALMPIGSRLAQATSDADGLVRFEDLPGGSTVTLSPEQRVSRQTGWPGDLELRAGETRVLDDITLDLARMAVSGVVMLPDRTPVQGASVCARGVDRPVRTDAEGRFRIQDLSPSEPVTIIAGSPDGRLWGTEEVVPEWEFEPGIILGKTVRLTARLVDLNGKPVPNRGVLITAGFYGYGNTELPIQAKRTTDETGKLAIDGLVPGVRYQLYVDDAGPNPKTGSLCREFVPEPDADCDLGDIAVDKH